ncbi:hypothetical protein SAMN06265171_105287 [Chryseobacterium rhizoplanae]|uniref:Uncharacterized protein n=2 Tax=Chryseobacterium TaxID=59732 RepID=A0A521DP51_9FLAO|nr:hypothetical protein [Chryseobacterium rhizoplanae]SMO72861.1 hypothetical protein SAMN06265171_105287 [Chryseobacterium rhizoplanae]
MDLAPNDFIGSIYFSPRTAGILNISGGSSINSYYRGDGTTLLSDLIFRTSDGERFRINPIGNIGIGTAAPNHLLDLGPNIGTTSGDMLGKKLAVYNNTAGTDFYGLGVNAGILQFHAGSGPTISPGMVLSSSGKVGIGTTAPHNTLDLGLYLASNATDVLGEKLAVYNNADGTDFYGLGSSTDILQFHAGSTSAKSPGMVLNSAGKVGIGTTAPNNTLDLGSNIGSSPNDVLGKKLALYNNATGNSFYGVGVSSGILQFHAGSATDKAPAMVLSSVGNLGIGTTSPKKTMDIEGTARISQTVADNIPNRLMNGTNEPLYASTTDGTVRFAPNGYTRVSGGYRPGGNALIATFPKTNLIARIRFVHYVDNSDDTNNGRAAAYTYGDFTIIGMDYNHLNTIVDVTIKGYDGNPKSFTRTDTSISWVNSNLGTTKISIDQDNGELRVTNTNGTVYSYFFEILGGI